MSVLRDALLRRGHILAKTASEPDVRDFIEDFRKNYVSVDLVRVGSDGDGGYLVPDIFEDVSHCFSPGVDVSASFETELSNRYGIKSFMADASVAKAPVDDPNFHFLPKFLGATNTDQFMTLETWMSDVLDGSERGLILQMDIEGAEYEVLTFESAELLARFSVLVIEFHDLERIFDRFALRLLRGMFEKIFQNFSVCHIHPNNNAAMARCRGTDVPRLMEVTFLRHDYCEKLKNDAPISLPHPLDKQNVLQRPDIVMPRDWWAHSKR